MYDEYRDTILERLESDPAELAFAIYDSKADRDDIDRSIRSLFTARNDADLLMAAKIFRLFAMSAVDKYVDKEIPHLIQSEMDDR